MGLVGNASIKMKPEGSWVSLRFRYVICTYKHTYTVYRLIYIPLNIDIHIHIYSYMCSYSNSCSCRFLHLCMCDLYMYVGFYMSACLYINIYTHFEVDITVSIVFSILKMVGTRGKKQTSLGQKTPAATECRTSFKSRFLHVEFPIVKL